MDGSLYYQDGDDNLIKSNIWPPAPAQMALCPTKIASPPAPGPKGGLYFQGKDNKFYRVSTD